MNCLVDKDMRTGVQAWETNSDSQTTDDDIDLSSCKHSDECDEESPEKEDLNTKVLNMCSKEFNSLLFIVPPEIRTEEETDGEEGTEGPAIDSDLTKSILTSLGEDLAIRPPKTVPAEPPKKVAKGCELPDGGWVCLLCQNYNFRGRTKCNRCGKLKTKYDPEGKPQHLVKRGSEEGSPGGGAHAKQLRERLGDWLCIACRNINFCFRQHCNRCKREKTLAGVPLSEEYVWARSFQRQIKHFPLQCDDKGCPIIFQQLLTTAA